MQAARRRESLEEEGASPKELKGGEHTLTPVQQTADVMGRRASAPSGYVGPGFRVVRSVMERARDDC